MKTTGETRQQLLDELIEHSAQIDRLVLDSKQTVGANQPHDQELQTLRLRQQAITEKLHGLEKSNSNAWENIGDGG
ncbi:MAG: hypothetical protein ABL903_04960 [Methylococcales bacterium]